MRYGPLTRDVGTMMTVRALSVAATAMFLAMALVSCGNKQNGAPEAPAVASAPGVPVDAATAGTITGSVKLDGNPPAMNVINMAAAEKCSEKRTSPAMTQQVVAGDNGTLQNVVVYLEGDFSKYSFPTPTTPVLLDQRGCMFEPHVVALMTEQPLRVTNSDGMTHNVNGAAKNNQRRNQSTPAGGAPMEQTFSSQEIAIPVKCNVHPWMKAYVAVVANPYFQVTGKDGSFELKNVPPGTYKLTAWQETYGTTEQTITIGPKEDKMVTLTFKAAAGSS
jgi:hypothetical protein